jgi:hypothetical protein
MRRTFDPTPEQRRTLRELARRHPKPYVRERAAALLKLADGQSAAEVARSGLLQRRRPETVGRWRDRFLAEGVAGLRIRPGRGRRPAFSPSAG